MAATGKLGKPKDDHNQRRLSFDIMEGSVADSVIDHHPAAIGSTSVIKTVEKNRSVLGSLNHGVVGNGVDTAIQASTKRVLEANEEKSEKSEESGNKKFLESSKSDGAGTEWVAVERGAEAVKPDN
jgi:hypothetical protein